MKSKNRIVIYGGSFNPPLNSHFAIAEQVLNQYEEVDKIIFIPVNKAYAKNGLIENKYRYHMLKAVTDKNDRFMVSDIDLQKNHSLSTIETLEEIQKQFIDKELSFLIGSDNLKEIHTWKRVEELLSYYQVLVMERENDRLEDIVNGSEFLQRYQKNIKRVNPEIKSNFSATYIREQIKNKKSVRYLMPDEVYEYIKKNGLYKG